MQILSSEDDDTMSSTRIHEKLTSILSKIEECNRAYVEYARTSMVPDFPFMNSFVLWFRNYTSVAIVQIKELLSLPEIFITEFHLFCADIFTTLNKKKDIVLLSEMDRYERRDIAIIYLRDMAIITKKVNDELTTY